MLKFNSTRIPSSKKTHSQNICKVSCLIGCMIILSSCDAMHKTVDTSVGAIKKSQEDQTQPLSKAEVAFVNGDYGNAERYYRKSVEKSPKNADAWLGLAATYDRLRQFKKANRAYTITIELDGYTPAVLNNLGYHYILRGKYKKARKTLTAAIKIDPGNEVIQNNIDILDQEEKRNKKLVKAQR